MVILLEKKNSEDADKCNISRNSETQKKIIRENLHVSTTQTNKKKERKKERKTCKSLFASNF